MAKLKKETALRHADNATEIFVKFLDTDRQVRAIQVDKDDAAFAPMIAAYKQAQEPATEDNLAGIELPQEITVEEKAKKSKNITPQ